MSLITHTPSSPCHVTAAMAKQYAQAEMNTIFARLKTAYAELYRRAWRGRDYSPADYFKAMGKDGAEVVIILDALSTAINAIKPGTLSPEQIGIPEGLSAKMFMDGTVGGTVVVTSNAKT